MSGKERMSPLDIIIVLKSELGMRDLFLGSYETFGLKQKTVRHLVVTVRNPWPKISANALLLFPDIPVVINDQMVFRPNTKNIFKLTILPADEEDVRGINFDLINNALANMDIYAEKLFGIK